MSEEDFSLVNTKLKAYKLIHDPTVLLNLIYSKYGDIEEDLELLYINQLVYDKSSRYNIYFKEYNFYFNEDEYLKRFYRKFESKPRIPKLSEYYKSYHAFFCRPRFKDLVISDLIQSYEDDRAELFYKKNFENSLSNDSKDKSGKHNSESLSSLDNITDNKIIFTKKTKKIIDKNLDSKSITLTLTLNSIKLNLNNNDKNNNNEDIETKITNNGNINEGLISSRDANDSFEKIVHNLIYLKKTKKKVEKNKKNIKKNKGKNTIKDEKVHPNNKSKNNNKRKTTPYTNNNKIKNKISFFSLLKQTNTINYTKQNKNIIHNKNKSNINNDIFTPKISKENGYFQSKLQEFHNNLVKQTNSSHHQRNKTFNFNQNKTVGINSNNYLNNLNNLINMKNKNSRNDFNNFNNFNSLKKITQLNNFLTVNNNIINGINGQKVNHSKNKTFDNQNINSSIVKKIPSKIMFDKNNGRHNGSNNININNQIIIKRNHLVKSKYNLVKAPFNNKKMNNKINLNKNVKINNFKYYNTKFSPSNIFYRNLLNNNNININSHKKIQTTYMASNIEMSPNNKPSSPKIMKINQKQYYNINKSDTVSSKIKPKIAKDRINNLNINFNNVIFNAPLSNINENINFNNNIINSSNSFNLVTASNNNNLINNNTYMNNNYLNNSSNTYNNVSEGENFNDKNIYIMNLKNVYNNISRNKLNLYGNSLSQTNNFSITKNNTKTNYDMNKNKIVNHTYSNLYSNDKKDIKKNKILIKKSSTKSGNQKNSKKIIKSSMKKSKKNIIKKNEYGNNSNHLIKKEKKKIIDTEERINESLKFKNQENNNIYISPNTTGRNYIVKPINVNLNSNLFSKKNIKSKKKIK